jgi:hypothetical protein
MYRDGEGVGRDATEAYYWSSLAAETVGVELQEKAAATRFELGEGISRQARADADERADAWRAARKPAPSAPKPAPSASKPAPSASKPAGDADSDGTTTPDKL